MKSYPIPQTTSLVEFLPGVGIRKMPVTTVPHWHTPVKSYPILHTTGLAELSLVLVPEVPPSHPLSVVPVVFPKSLA